MSRWRAAGLHLLISIAIGAAAFALLRLLWYPDFYFAAIGAGGLVMLLFIVDLVLGPLITLIIFKSGKKGLKLDLAVIATCQLVALLYGMHTVFLARPLFAVFSDDHFEIVQAMNLDISGAEQAVFQVAPWTGPRWAALKLNGEDEALSKAVADSVFEGKSLSEHLRYLAPYDESGSAAIAKAKKVEHLHRKGKGPQASERVQNFLADHKLDEAQVGYLPLRARTGDMAVVLARPGGEIVGVIQVNPW